MLISVSDECVCCGACEAINPDIFQIDSTARVNLDKIEGNEQDLWIDDIF